MDTERRPAPPVSVSILVPVDNGGQGLVQLTQHRASANGSRITQLRIRGDSSCGLPQGISEAMDSGSARFSVSAAALAEADLRVTKVRVHEWCIAIIALTALVAFLLHAVRDLGRVATLGVNGQAAITRTWLNGRLALLERQGLPTERGTLVAVASGCLDLSGVHVAVGILAEEREVVVPRW